jgi:hypothetical protein
MIGIVVVAVWAASVMTLLVQAFVLTLQPVVLDRHVLTIDVTGFAKPLAERGYKAR